MINIDNFEQCLVMLWRQIQDHIWNTLRTSPQGYVHTSRYPFCGLHSTQSIWHNSADIIKCPLPCGEWHHNSLGERQRRLNPFLLLHPGSASGFYFASRVTDEPWNKLAVRTIFYSLIKCRKWMNVQINGRCFLMSNITLLSGYTGSPSSKLNNHFGLISRRRSTRIPLTSLTDRVGSPMDFNIGFFRTAVLTLPICFVSKHDLTLNYSRRMIIDAKLPRDDLGLHVRYEI